MKPIPSLLLSLSALICLPAAAETPAPGLWQLSFAHPGTPAERPEPPASVRPNSAGDEGRAPRGEGPGAGNPPVHTLCLTASDDPNQVFFMPPRHRQRADGPPPCTLNYLAQTDASANWSLSCDGPRGLMQAQGQAQFSADHYSASLSFASETRGPEHGRMVTASRLGDCPATPAITDQE